MPASIGQRVRKRREVLRAAGLRPVQMWLADTRRPGFDDECLRQSRIAAAADATDPSLDAFTDAALVDIAGEGEA